MDDAETPDLAPNANRFNGFSDLYDQVRPQPPSELARVLIAYCGKETPDVIDIGSGTGLSTRWAAKWAGSVTGVDPSPDMRRIAESRPLANVRYVEAYAHETGLAPASADVVVAVQALHWMEPAATFVEVRRLLRPGGVFAAVDCDWPPTTGSAELEQAWTDCRKSLRVCETRLANGWTGEALFAPVGDGDPALLGYSGSDAHRDRALAMGVKSWSKDSHLSRMNASGLFAWCHELALHQVENGDAARYVDLLRSQGDYQTLRQSGFDDEMLGVSVLEQTASRVLGSRRETWWLTYRVRVGVVATD